MEERMLPIPAFIPMDMEKASEMASYLINHGYNAGMSHDDIIRSLRAEPGKALDPFTFAGINAEPTDL